MKKIGLFYKTDSHKTASIAQKIEEELGSSAIKVVPLEKAWQKDFESFDNIILGASTWFDGELPTYWDELIPELRTLHLQGKRIAIFGLGDQKEYPDNFVDAIGLLAQAVETAGATVVGLTSIDGYSFTRSGAIRDGQFLGLALDIENQAPQNAPRIKAWVKKLKKEFQ